MGKLSIEVTYKSRWNEAPILQASITLSAIRFSGLFQIQQNLTVLGHL